jgi:flagellar motor switch protein FliG
VDFADAMSNTGSLIGSFSTTERLLERALGKERVAPILEEIRGPAGRTMWDKLANVHEQVLANYLKNEYPQTSAVILSKIRPDHSARVLSLLPDGFAMEVIMRMLHMQAVQKEVLDGVEKTLRVEFMANLAKTARTDSHQLMAEIFNSLDRATETRFMTGLENRNREAAEKIRSLMFTFDDLMRLDTTAIQIIIKDAPKSQMTLALKGASAEVRDLFLNNMSGRAAKMLVEDMASLGPVRLKDVDEAQATIVTFAKTLAETGQIVIPDAGAPDEMIY